MQKHLYSFHRYKKCRSLVYQHPNKHNHDIDFIKIQPLEVVAKKKGQSHSQHEKARMACELSWIKKLQTAYPLGLNDNILGKGNISKNPDMYRYYGNYVKENAQQTISWSTY